jgi:uncharacterized protein
VAPVAALVPVVSDGDGRWHGTLQEQRHELAGEEQVAEFRANVIRRGYYPFRTDPDQLRELEQDEPRLDALFQDRMLRRSSSGGGSRRSTGHRRSPDTRSSASRW